MSCWRCSAGLLILAAASLHAAGPSSLADATEKLNRPAVRALLKQNADVNAAQADGMTALHWAAYHDDQEIAAQLLRAGANVKAANRYGVTPLSLACTNGNEAISPPRPGQRRATSEAAATSMPETSALSARYHIAALPAAACEELAAVP